MLCPFYFYGRQCILLIFKLNLKDTRGCKKCLKIWEPDLLLFMLLLLHVSSIQGTTLHVRKIHARGTFRGAEMVLVRATSFSHHCVSTGMSRDTCFVTGMNEGTVDRGAGRVMRHAA